MKKLFVFAVLIISICSCKKNYDSTPTVQSYIRFKLNGVQVECDNKFYATPKLTVGHDANITFYGRWQDNEIDFELNSIDITPGYYVLDPLRSFSDTLWPNGTAQTNGNHPSYIAGTPLGATTTAGFGVIAITEINAGFIKGNFDFTTAPNPNTGIFMTVTDGEYYIKR